MKEALSLFGKLIIAFLGFVVPILGILLTLYRQGIAKLTEQYENQKEQNVNNIKDFQKKINDAKDLSSLEQEIKDYKHTIKRLKKSEKLIERKLSYLPPKIQIYRLAIPLLGSLLFVIIAQISEMYFYVFYLFIVLSVLSFVYTLNRMKRLIDIIVEVRDNVDIMQKETDPKLIELLTNLVEKKEEGSSNFLKNVFINLDGSNLIKNDVVINLKINQIKAFKIGFNNQEKRMIKKLEFGFTIPQQFIIDKSSGYSIYSDGEKSVIRYRSDFIHGKTIWYYKDLSFTPLEKGTYRLRTFINAENIEPIHSGFTIVVGD